MFSDARRRRAEFAKDRVKSYLILRRKRQNRLAENETRKVPEFQGTGHFAERV